MADFRVELNAVLSDQVIEPGESQALEKLITEGPSQETSQALLDAITDGTALPSATQAELSRLHILAEESRSAVASMAATTAAASADGVTKLSGLPRVLADLSAAGVGFVAGSGIPFVGNFGGAVIGFLASEGLIKLGRWSLGTD